MLKRNFYLKRCPAIEAEIHVSRGDINNRGERCSSAIEADFHGPKLHGDLLIVWLIGFHCTHRAEAGIAAALSGGVNGNE
jgi:hypothetical protein